MQNKIACFCDYQKKKPRMYKKENGGKKKEQGEKSVPVNIFHDYQLLRRIPQDSYQIRKRMSENLSKGLAYLCIYLSPFKLKYNLK